VDLRIEGQSAPESSGSASANERVVSPDYFRAMGIPILNGRGFTERDTAETPKVVIVNSTFVRRYFSERDPIGQRIILNSEPDLPKEVVGVVGDVKEEGLVNDSNPEIYTPHMQGPISSVALVVRTHSKPESFTLEVKRAIWGNELDAPISRVRTMKQILIDGASRTRFNVLLLATFSILAVLLAAIGIYGVISHLVTQRTRELGI